MSLSAAVWLKFATQSFRVRPYSWKQFPTYLLLPEVVRFRYLIGK